MSIKNFKWLVAKFILVSFAMIAIVVPNVRAEDVPETVVSDSTTTVSNTKSQEEEGRFQNRQQRLQNQRGVGQPMMRRREQNPNEEQSRQDDLQDKTISKQPASCDRIAEMTAQVANRLSEKGQNFDDRKTNWQQKWQDHITQADANLSKDRDAAKQRRQGMYDKLMERATTDAQKASVTKFETMIEAAVTERQAAVDVAIKEFRTSVSALRDSKKTTLTTGVDTFKQAIQEAASTATSQCKAGTDPQTVRENFRSAVDAARTTLQSARQSVDTMSENVSTLAQTREDAIKTALKTFQTQVGAAREELKKVFSEVPAR